MTQAGSSRRILPDGHILLHVAALLILAAAALPWPASAEDACAAPAAQADPGVTVDDATSNPLWRSRVAQTGTLLRSTDLRRVRLLLLGDSIIEAWPDRLLRIGLGPGQVLNLGVRGDTPQSLLRRLEGIPLGGALRPKAVMLLIGTNAIFPGRPPEDSVRDIADAVRSISARSPESRILLVGVLPRGANRADPVRTLIRRVDDALAGCADGTTVVYEDPGPLLLDTAGRLSDLMAYDYLHPSWHGYEVLSERLRGTIRRLLDQPDQTASMTAQR